MIDLTAALEEYYRSHPNERGDEDKAHVSDLFGCDLATWARRRGEPQLPHDQPTRTKFALGNAVEDHVAEALADQLAAQGYKLVRNVVVAVRFEDDGELVACDPSLEDALIGHLDYMLEHPVLKPIVIEVKSTSFLKGKPPTEAREHYVIQGATYALAKEAPAFAVFIVCRESGKVAEFWFETADYEVDVRKRIMRVIAMTGRDAFPPAAEPPYGWLCSYCNYGACEKNRNKARGVA